MRAQPKGGANHRRVAKGQLTGPQALHGIILSLLLCCLTINAFAGFTPLHGSSNFSRVQLPEGVSLEVPKSWSVLSGASKALVDTWLEAKSFTKSESKAGFIAEAYNDNDRRLAALHVRYFPKGLLTQADVKKLSRSELARLDKTTRDEAERAYRAFGDNILSWESSAFQDINDLVAVVYGFRRNPSAGDAGIFRVRVIRILTGSRSFSVTISYVEQAAPILEPVTDYIIRSIRQD